MRLKTAARTQGGAKKAIEVIENEYINYAFAKENDTLCDEKIGSYKYNDMYFNDSFYQDSKKVTRYGFLKIYGTIMMVLIFIAYKLLY